MLILVIGLTASFFIFFKKIKRSKILKKLQSYYQKKSIFKKIYLTNQNQDQTALNNFSQDDSNFSQICKELQDNDQSRVETIHEEDDIKNQQESKSTPNSDAIISNVLIALSQTDKN